MIKVFLDTDVVLDLFLDRQPHSDNSAMIFQLAKNGSIALYTSITTFTNSYYILTKLISNTKAKQKITFLENRISVLSSNQDTIKNALHSQFDDFENAVQHFTAMENDIDVLITRNLKYYTHAIIPVMSPERFLQSGML